MEQNHRPPRNVRFGVFEADMEAGELRKHGLRLKLSEQPFQILAMLVARPGEVVSRDDLAQGALGRSVAPFDRSIDNHISSLRKKLGNKVDGVERIRSVRGNG